MRCIKVWLLFSGIYSEITLYKIGLTIPTSDGLHPGAEVKTKRG